MINSNFATESESEILTGYKILTDKKNKTKKKTPQANQN